MPAQAANEMARDLFKLFRNQGRNCTTREIEFAISFSRFFLFVPGLLAAGIQANTADLGLEVIGVTVDEHGFVQTDDRYETSTPGIYGGFLM